ncbi:MAG: regulatory iron-sulfur-containing complex subunit RicT [Patescibacteria group bacterium]
MIRHLACVQFNPWDQVYRFDAQDLSVAPGDRVLVKAEGGPELGTVVSLVDVEADTFADLPPLVIRLATAEDLQHHATLERNRSGILNQARELVASRQLQMKLIDCYFSFDGGKVTLIFTADGRVDFRDLVKDLARTFQKSIRLQQVGIRDEARRMGGMGPCGRELCCRTFMSSLTSVTTDMARLQGVNNRGSDRISGGCGRLMCCLGFEKDFYQNEVKKYPATDSQVKTGQGTGRVLSFNILKGTVTVIIDNSAVEVPLAEVKKV